MVVRKSTQPVRGIVPALITPLCADARTVDVASLERIVEHVITGGVHGLFMLGTTGEWCALSTQARHDVIEHSIRAARGRVPVYVQITDACLEDSVELARHAETCGADAVIVSAPFYYPLRQTDLIRYVRMILSRQGLPVIVYNIPQMTGTAYEIETLKRLLEDPRVIALKDSSGDLAYHNAAIDATSSRSDFGVLVGNEFLLAQAMRLGSRGAVGGCSIIDPPLLVSAYEAGARDYSELDRLQGRIQSMGEIFTLEHTASAIGAVKHIMKKQGVIDHELMAEPYGLLGPEEMAIVDATLRRYFGPTAQPERATSEAVSA